MNVFLWCLVLSLALMIATLFVGRAPIRLALAVLAAVVLLIAVLIGTGVIVAVG